MAQIVKLRMQARGKLYAVTADDPNGRVLYINAKQDWTQNRNEAWHYTRDVAFLVLEGLLELQRTGRHDGWYDEKGDAAHFTFGLERLGA